MPGITTTKISWGTLFETLLNKDELNFSPIVTDTEIIIKTNKENAEATKKQIETVLASPQNFQNTLNYSINKANASVVQSLPPTNSNNDAPPPPENSIEEGKALLLRLFGSDIFEEFSIDLNSLFNEKFGAKTENGVLISKPAKTFAAQAQNALANALLSRFNNIDIFTLRKIWESKDNATHLPAIPSTTIENNENTVAKGPVQQCFGRIQDDSGTKIFFNYGRLYQFLYPPVITLQADPLNEATVELHIKKDHLTSYVQQLSQDGILFKIYKTRDEALARPIFLSNKSIEAASKPFLYTLILDRSGSMRENLPKLKEYVINFLTELSKRDNSAKVRIIFFESNTDMPKEFNINEIESIKIFLTTVQAGYETRLFDTMIEEFQFIHNQRLTETYNISMVIFTDGRNNLSAPFVNIAAGSKEENVIATFNVLLGHYSNMQIYTMEFILWV